MTRPAKPSTVNANPYSRIPCQKYKIYASPAAICKIPQRNPESNPHLIPQRKQMINTGSIASEMDPPAGSNLNFKKGKRSSIKLKAVKIATSIKNNVLLEAIVFPP